jgi:hypothetical protein
LHNSCMCTQLEEEIKGTTVQDTRTLIVLFRH